MTIQFYDTTTGEPVTGPIDYEGAIWAEGQLTDDDEDVIEHLSVGELAELSGGWSVRRLS